MKTITAEYFENMLDSLFEDSEDLQNSLLKQYVFDENSDIYITPNAELDLKDEIECLEKLHTRRDGMDIYMYRVKVDRSHLSKKPIE
jgi:hypothetical protein